MGVIALLPNLSCVNNNVVELKVILFEIQKYSNYYGLIIFWRIA